MKPPVNMTIRLRAPRSTAPRTWFAYRKEDVPREADSPIYISPHDRPQDSPSLGFREVIPTPPECKGKGGLRVHPKTSKKKRLTQPKLGTYGRDFETLMNQQRLYPEAFPRPLVANQYHKVVGQILEPTAAQLSRARSELRTDEDIEIDDEGLIEFFTPVAGFHNNYPVPPPDECDEKLTDEDIRMMFPRVPGKLNI